MIRSYSKAGSGNLCRRLESQGIITVVTNVYLALVERRTESYYDLAAESMLSMLQKSM